MIEVKIWGQILGVLVYDKNKKQSRFAYNPEFNLKQWNVAPILMPDKEGHDGEFGPFSAAKDPFFEGLPPMIADSLPDDFGNDVLKNWLRKNDKNVEDLNPELKLSYVGKRGMGALEYAPQLIEESEPLEIDLRELSEISNLITETNLLPEKITRVKMEELFRVGTSAGGARSKAVVAINFKTNEILYSNAQIPGFTPVIIKFDKFDSEGKSAELGKIEYIYHKMATLAGIEMMPCGLIKNNGLEHFITHRFDRKSDGSKVHMQTLAGIAGMNPRETHDYEDIFRVGLKLHLPYIDMVQLYRRMVFNYMTSNDDCHTKNWAFTMDQSGEWRISPAYDLTFPYDLPKIWKRPHPLTLKGKQKDVKITDMLLLAKEFGIKNAEQITKEISQACLKWQKLAKETKLSSAKTELIEEYFWKE